MPNRIKTEIKDGILEAFEQVGGVEYLVEIAKVDPPTFCRLLAAIIPSEIKASLTTKHTFDLGRAMLEANQNLAVIEHNDDEG